MYDGNCFPVAANTNLLAAAAGPSTGPALLHANRQQITQATDGISVVDVEDENKNRLQRSQSSLTYLSNHDLQDDSYWEELQPIEYQQFLTEIEVERKQLAARYPYKPSGNLNTDVSADVKRVLSAPQQSSPRVGKNIHHADIGLTSVSALEANILNRSFKQAIPPSNFEIRLSLSKLSVDSEVSYYSPAYFERKREAFQLLKEKKLLQQDPPLTVGLELPSNRKIIVPIKSTDLVLSRRLSDVIQFKPTLPTFEKSVATNMATELPRSTRSVISDSVIAPKSFSNSTDTDPEVWLNYFLKFVSFKKLNENETKGLFSMLLHGPASDWFTTLDLPESTTFADIVDKFKANYYPSVELKWREMANVWNTKQGESESVNVFLTRLKVLSRRSKMTEESLHYAFLNGLKPQLRLHCLQNGVTTLEQTLRSALVAEVSGVADPMTTLILDSLKQNSVASEQQLLQIKALTDKVNDLALSAVSQPQTAASPVVAAFAPTQTSSSSSERTDRQPDRRQSNRRDDRRNNGRGEYGPQQTQDYVARPRRFNPQREQRERYVKMQAERYASAPQQRQTPQPEKQGCGRCGLMHAAEADCFAKAAICYSCGKRGHFSRVCLSARPSA